MINTLRAIETEFSVIGWKGLSYTVDHVSPYSRRHSFLSIHFLHLVAPVFLEWRVGVEERCWKNYHGTEGSWLYTL